MESLLILYQNEYFKEAVKRYYKYNCPHVSHSLKTYHLDFFHLTGSSVLDEFKRFCNYTEKHFTPQQLLKTGVIVEYPLEQIKALGFDLNPLNLAQEKNVPSFSLLCMMSLCFPELCFFFFGLKRQDLLGAPGDQSSKHFPSSAITSTDLKCLFSKYPCALFDGYRFRSDIKSHLVIDEETEMDCKGIPVRRHFAAALDEEEAYSFFNAYTAFRFGFLAIEVSLYEKALWVFRDQKANLRFLFEDLYMSFPDQDPDIRLSDLEQRDNELACFKNDCLEKRILVTVGHKHTENWKKNLKYLKDIKKKKQIFKYKILYKPTGGIFDLWKSSGMWNNRKNSPVSAPGFEWPPEKGHKDENQGGHSAPGRLLFIAQRVIDRSEKMLKEAITVPEAIHAAVLALEAKELLGNRTPTASLEALSLQHEAEITAESMFYGVKYNLNVKDRLNDIKTEVEAISDWFHEDSKKMSEINARLSVVQNLAKNFRLMNQFEEEQECLTEARNLRFKFWMQQKAVNRLAWPLLKYIEHALFSLPRFFFILFLWIVLFGFLYHVINSVWGTEPRSFFEAFTASIRPFFAAEPSDYWVDLENAAGQPVNFGPTIWNLIVSIQGFISAFNLTLLIAHIYLIVSRR